MFISTIITPFQLEDAVVVDSEEDVLVLVLSLGEEDQDVTVIATTDEVVPLSVVFSEPLPWVSLQVLRLPVPLNRGTTITIIYTTMTIHIMLLVKK